VTDHRHLHETSSAAPLAVRPLGEGIFQLATDYPEVCNAPLWTYLVTSEDGYVLIDPGVQSTFEATLSRAVSESGQRVEGVDLVLATHGHPDHSGGQSSWRAVAPKVRVGAPLVDAPWVESFDRQWVQFWDDYPGIIDNSSSRELLASLCVPEPQVDLLLRDGDVFFVGSRDFRVVETRGHSWGHCAYYDVRSRTLFTGDAVQGRGIASSDGTTVFAPLYVDVEGARWGLRRLLELPFDMLCPAHAAPMDRDAGLAFIKESLAFIDEVEELTLRMLEESGSSPLLTRDLANRIGSLVGAMPSLTPQTAPTARAHLYQLARSGLIDAAWIRSEGTHGE
jgi:glyoxylase-like metal-dependent hydrolase (beta-lactamase superfamily II)